MLYTDNKIPGYLLPTNETTVYDFRFGGIPKVPHPPLLYYLLILTASRSKVLCTKNSLV